MPSRNPFTALVTAPRVTAWVAAVSCLGTILLGAVVLPGLGPVLQVLPEGPQFGVALVLSTSVRIGAGVVGARALRRRDGLPERTSALGPVALGVAVGWLAYALLVLLAGGAGPGRLLLELLRWLAEAALGAYLVNPDDAGDSSWDRSGGRVPGVSR